ncbi:putative F-box/LRR-repeat protein 23 [Corylus avellana]|uniref:putative F-box/LRR-repeat protein 23 n=1 Tax=Corylus avellana TaxID=13451 RepID=UPI001E2173B4|nr:putative F-box/LRR-repeat protein 23 [Corylus avellana]
MDPIPDLSDEFPNWLELPRDVTASILLRLGAVEILTSAQMVCSPWRNLCKDPSMWRAIDMGNNNHWNDDELNTICRDAVDRSCGQLVDINLEYFGTDKLLRHIADGSSQLKRLRLVHCYYDISDEGLSEVAAKLPLLEELAISYCPFSKEALKAVGRSCPLLKSLKFNNQDYGLPRIECDEEALAIAENMPRLRHLQLFGNNLTNDGLQAILDGCPHLESFDLRQCFSVKLTGNLERRCAQQIKNLRLPHDSTDDYEFGAELDGYGSFDDDYPSGSSDIDHLSHSDYYEFSDGSNFSDLYDSDYDYDDYYDRNQNFNYGDFYLD